MRLYIHMILCGSLYTLMYMLFDRILPYEFPLKWKRWLLRVNILFYLLPVPWLAAELRDVIKMLLETVVGITFPEVHDIKEIDTFNGTDLWKSMLVFNEEGKLIYITGYEKVMPVIKAVLVLCMTALFLYKGQPSMQKQYGIFGQKPPIHTRSAHWKKGGSGNFPLCFFTCDGRTD